MLDFHAVLQPSLQRGVCVKICSHGLTIVRIGADQAPSAIRQLDWPGETFESSSNHVRQQSLMGPGRGAVCRKL
jgi:hypothetical protein